jgi:heptosyltransferase-2
MHLIIETPTWLGDSVMASGAIDKLIKELNPSKVTIFGSFVSTSLFPEYEAIIDKREDRFKNFFNLPKADMFVSFRRSLYSKLLALKYGGYTLRKSGIGHLSEQYNSYINSILKKELPNFVPKLNFKPKSYDTITIGLNPGAAFGAAKRWYPEEFAKVANALNASIIIFGGPGEEEMAKAIEDNLDTKNYINLCGKLSIKELCESIGGLDLLVTNDSGPMHIAASYGVKTVAVIGPTSYKHTYPYNTKYKIVTKNLECAPCNKRVCPLKTHACMKEISASDVIKAIKELNPKLVKEDSEY